MNEHIPEGEENVPAPVIPDEERALIRRAVLEVYAAREPLTAAQVAHICAHHEKMWLIRLNSKTYLNSGAFPDPRASQRRWVCVSTMITPVWLMLECWRTGARGVVKDPTYEEWCSACDAMRDPMPWWNNSRVTLMREGTKQL